MKRPSLRLYADRLEVGDRVGFSVIVKLFDDEIRFVCRCKNVYTRKKIEIRDSRKGGRSIFHCGAKDCRNSFTKLRHVRTDLLRRCGYDIAGGSASSGPILETVCLGWRLSLARFAFDALECGWVEGYDIDRKDLTKGYCRENIRFVTRKRKANNRQRTPYISLNDVCTPLTIVAESYGVKRSLVYDRIKAGWSIEQIVANPVKPGKRLRRLDVEYPTCLEEG